MCQNIKIEYTYNYSSLGNCICKKNFLAISKVKGYNLHIFAKLEVKKRTETIARTRELGLIKE